MVAASKEHLLRALLPLCGMRTALRAARKEHIPLSTQRLAAPSREMRGTVRHAAGLNFFAPLALVRRLILQTRFP
jgi:hypothetical protein